MISLRSLTILLLCLASCLLAGAQAKDPADKPARDDKAKPEKKEPKVKVGDKAVPIKVDHILHPKLKSLAELRGRLILYEYFQHW